MGRIRHLVAGAAVGGMLLAACGGGDSEQPSAGPTTERTPGDAGAPADLVGLTEADLTSVLSKDSIPSIDDPTFIAPNAAAEWLAAQEPVAALEWKGEARAYPLQIMTWHEIVNDLVGGDPLAVSYCPLCNSALAYPREVQGRVLEFGTSGSLYRSALVMYDRQTDSLWLHFEGLAIEGPLEGTQLEFIPMQILSFEQFRSQFPDGTVLDRPEGFDRPYGQNPYEFYDTGERPFLFRGEADDRMHAMARVVGVRAGDEAVAYPYRVLSRDGEAGVINDTVGGRRIAVFWKAGVRSALDDPEIKRGRDVGSSGVFVPNVAGTSLTFRARGDRIVDEETGTVWSLSGKAVSGQLAGQELQPVNHLDTFWFAWAAHNSETSIFQR